MVPIPTPVTISGGFRFTGGDRVSQGGQSVMAKSSLEIAKLLLNSGTDVNVADDEGCAPLHAATQSWYRVIEELLLYLDLVQVSMLGIRSKKHC
jgi:hypothetical protein